MNEQPVHFGRPQREASHGCQTLLLVVLASVATLLVAAIVNDSRRAGPTVTVDTNGLAIEHLESGEALWDLARVYSPTQDPREWIERVKQLNSWREVPVLQPYEAFIVPDWRAWPPNIETREKPDGSVELVPIDPWADGGADGRATGKGQ